MKPIPQGCSKEIWSITALLQLKTSDSNKRSLPQEIQFKKEQNKDNRYNKIKDKIAKDGFCSYLAISDGKLVNGHHRLAAAIDLGYDYLPVVNGPRQVVWKYSRDHKSETPLIKR